MFSGYCAAQLALSYPEDFRVAAMIYPLLDTKDKIYVDGPGPNDPTVLRVPLKDMHSKDDTLAWIEQQRDITVSKGGLDRIAFATAACQYGWFESHIFDNQRLSKPKFSPWERLQAGGKLPPKV